MAQPPTMSKATVLFALSVLAACMASEADPSGSTDAASEPTTASSGPSSQGSGGSAPTTAGTSGTSGTGSSAGDTTATNASEASTAVDPTGDDSTGADPPPSDGSDLPVPPGPADLPAPDGAPGNLQVLNWAGFAAAVSYTFDDGQPTHIQHWPALKATGVNVTFYISTGNSGLEGYAAAFADAYASGSEIANHTVHHCYYDQACGEAPAGSHAAELDDADAYITETLGVPAVWTMAYPFGDTGYRTAAQERYFLGRGTPGGRISALDNTDPFNLPTFAAQGNEGEEVFDGAIDDTRAAGEWLTLLFHAILPGDNWYAGVDVDVITGSIAHAQAYGDVWIDSVVHVGAYWSGQAVVEGAATAAQGDATVLTWTLPDHFPPGRFVRVTVDGGTLSQGGAPLQWDGHGYYEVALDAGGLTIAP